MPVNLKDLVQASLPTGPTGPAGSTGATGPSVTGPTGPAGLDGNVTDPRALAYAIAMGI